MINCIATQPIVKDKSRRRLNIIVSERLNDSVSFQKIIELCTISNKRVNIDLDNLNLRDMIKELMESENKNDSERAHALICEPKPSKNIKCFVQQLVDSGFSKLVR